MRGMAGSAISVRNRLMDVFGLSDRIIVTVQAGVPDRLFQKCFEIGGVRRVAIQAFATLHRLMFDFALGQRIVVTNQAQVVAFFYQ